MDSTKKALEVAKAKIKMQAEDLKQTEGKLTSAVTEKTKTVEYIELLQKSIIEKDKRFMVLDEAYEKLKLKKEVCI